MIKWFCDICTLEILAPLHPVQVKAYTCSKNRNGVDTGWGESDDIAAAFCHPACAERLEEKIKAVFKDVV